MVLLGAHTSRTLHHYMHRPCISLHAQAMHLVTYTGHASRYMHRPCISLYAQAMHLITCTDHASHYMHRPCISLHAQAMHLITCTGHASRYMHRPCISLHAQAMNLITCTGHASHYMHRPCTNMLACQCASVFHLPCSLLQCEQEVKRREGRRGAWREGEGERRPVTKHKHATMHA